MGSLGTTTFGNLGYTALTVRLSGLPLNEHLCAIQPASKVYTGVAGCLRSASMRILPEKNWKYFTWSLASYLLVYLTSIYFWFSSFWFCSADAVSRAPKLGKTEIQRRHRQRPPRPR